MKILLTTDMGMGSAGLLALAQGLRMFGEVDIWVTETDWSRHEAGFGKSPTVPLDTITLADGSSARCLKGTSNQAVSLALAVNAPENIDLIISGLNETPHSSAKAIHARTYTGGVTAASEGLVWGIPGIAVSQVVSEVECSLTQWETAVAVTCQLVQELISDRLPPALYNIVAAMPDKPPCSFTRKQQRLSDYYQELTEAQAARQANLPYKQAGYLSEIIRLLPAPQLTYLLRLAQQEARPTAPTANVLMGSAQGVASMNGRFYAN